MPPVSLAVGAQVGLRLPFLPFVIVRISYHQSATVTTEAVSCQTSGFVDFGSKCRNYILILLRGVVNVA